MFICDTTDPSSAQEYITKALDRSANALLLPLSLKPKESEPKVLQFPDSVAAYYVPEVDEVAQRLAVAFYDAPGRDMMAIGVTGSRGKTTVSWLICGILEAMEQTTGTINSVGYSLAGELMDIDGELWRAPEDDEADEVESSAPFRITPYHKDRQVTQPLSSLNLTHQSHVPSVTSQPPNLPTSHPIPSGTEIKSLEIPSRKGLRFKRSSRG